MVVIHCSPRFAEAMYRVLPNGVFILYILVLRFKGRATIYGGAAQTERHLEMYGLMDIGFGILHIGCIFQNLQKIKII